MSSEAIYIYSIIKKANDQKFNYTGINGRKIKFLYYKDITAVVSCSAIINFDKLDKRELMKHIIVHEKVNEEITKNYNIVPMSFGTIAPNADEVLHILEKAYLQFKTSLEKTAGKVEFVVKVWWDRKKIINELINTNPEIQKLRQELFLKRGILGVPIKLRLGKALQQKAEERREIYIRNIQRFLGNLAVDFTLNKIIEEEMIANFSFLIKKSHESELDKRMAELGKKYKKELRFKYIGPMPPYSFVNINLKLGNFEVIDEARKLLGLDEEASFNKIKNEYYKFAYRYHPDKKLKKIDEKQEKIKKITVAYGVLKNYCQACDNYQSHDNITGEFGNKKYSFRRKDVKRTLIVK